MPKILIANGEELFCEKGKILLEALVEGNVFINNPCNGKGTCGKCRVKVLENGLSAIHATELRLLKAEEITAGIRLACMATVEGDCVIELPEQEQKHEVLTGGYLPEFTMDFREAYGVAVDIGTTTVALTLVDLRNGRELSHASAINAQKIYGLDVLTRISYEYEKGEKAISKLQTVLVESLNGLLEELCTKAGINKEEIHEIVVAANCCMTHMLLGVDARSMGRAPYEPEFLTAQSCPAADIGLKAGKNTNLYCLPQVSAYIGGDIVAGACVAGGVISSM